ncbi:hypothetical protein [Citrobacter phage Tr1]|nr:hypothetical protein [Citrobacter phage Tr1]
MVENFYKDLKVDFDFYIDAAHHVVDWNAKARGGTIPEITQEMFMSQISFVREELKEFQVAAEANDHVELLDAAADTFVVASFLSWMFFGHTHVDATLSLPMGDALPDNIYDSFMSYDELNTEPQHMAMLALTVTRMARDTLVRSVYNDKKVMKEVLKSNDSKYPTRKQILAVWETKDIDFALAQECAAIEERNKDREEGAYTGVHATFNDKQRVYVFFDDKGKIMKPSTFVKPNIAGIVNK